jgi:hypothetical protein
MSPDSIKISMRGFAEVISAKSNRKQMVLKRFRFPDSDDSVGRSNYYVKALSAIKRYHRGEADLVNSVLTKLVSEAALEPDARKRAKLLNNHRAISDYLKNFGARKLQIKKGKRLYFVHDNVLVSAHPDLVAEENGSLILFKLNLSKDDFSGGVGSLILHVMYEAANFQGLSIEPTAVECLQASSGTRIIGPKSGFPDKKGLIRGCQELSSLWPGV